MAITKAKRSVPKKQSAPRFSHRQSQIINHQSSRRIRFREANGKIVDDVEFSTSPEGHAISINFRDKSCLNFAIKTGFTLETNYSDWTTGQQRILREWPRLGSR